jgi:hypothetical protein
MPSSGVVLRLLDRLESYGLREEIVGDLIEEMARGRSPAWVCRQVVSLCGRTLSADLRRRAGSPMGIALILSGASATALTVVPAGRLIQAWLVLYYVSGMASLFAHMAAADRPRNDTRGDDDAVIG